MFIPKFEDIIVLDLETTINAPEPFFGAAPAHPTNKVVACGWKRLSKTGEDSDTKVEFTKGKLGEEETELFSHVILDFLKKDKELIIVGHNLSFDLHYLFKTMDEYEDFEISKKLVVWDTMKFEYIDSGRAMLNPSLVKTAKNYDIPFEKDDEVSERFKLGIGADKIDRELLSKYLHQDVEVTAKIFKEQIKKCMEEGAGYSNYMVEMMQGIIPTTYMSWVGMPFDVESAKAEVIKLECQRDSALLKLERFRSDKINYNSPSQVKLFLWGGETKEEYRERKYDSDGNALVYKSGAKKGLPVTRRATRYVPVIAFVNDRIKDKFKRNGWPMDASATTLSRLLRTTDSLSAINTFCGELLEIRKITKSINTYFKPYIEHAIYENEEGWPHGEHYIHPSYNHCATHTGRLSSNKPNMQNISGKKDDG